MSFLTISHLEKSFGALRVVKDFNLDVEKGEFISLLGPSGCGKTTVLRMVAGFETPSAGHISIDGRNMAGLKTAKRNVGMMFQAYALFPNLTVAENVGFGLKVAGVPTAERNARVSDMLALIGLPDLGGRYPFQLSGGQQQRVALARALAPKPRVLLLDEPLSALDAKVRVSLRNEIRSIQRELGITTIFVTHDQEEALSMSDRIVVMNGGVAEQVADPFTLYNKPATRFVATFVGQVNQLQARVLDPAQGRVALGGQHISLGRSLPNQQQVTLALRPEALRLGADPTREVAFKAILRDVDFLGAVIRLGLDVDGNRLSLDLFNRADAPPPAPGAEVTLAAAARDFIVLND